MFPNLGSWHITSYYQNTSPMRVILLLSALFLLTHVTSTAQASFAPPAQEVISVQDCNETTTICWDLPLEDLVDYTVTLDGAPYLGTLQGCNFDTLVAYFYNNVFGQGNQGPYRLDNWLVNGQVFTGTFQNMADLVSQMNAWDTNGTWNIDPMSLSITGGNPANEYGALFIVAIATSSASTVGANVTYQPAGTQTTLASGNYPFQFTHTNGTIINTTVTVRCNPTSDQRALQLYSGNSKTLCFDASTLTGPVVSVENACGPTQLANWQLDNSNCIEITSDVVGNEQLCLAFCDANGFCDTTFVDFTVTPLPTSEYMFDTIPGNGLPYAYCPDLSQLVGTVDTLFNACANANSDFVAFTFDTQNNCLKYQSLDCDGTEEACLVVCAGGMCDTTYFSVTVSPVGCAIPANQYTDTLLIGESGTFCLDTTLLPGQVVSVENSCADSSGMFVDFDVDPATYCVTYFGLATGVDKACLVLTDEFGNTALTTMCIATFELRNNTIIDTLLLGTNTTYCFSGANLPGTVVSLENICPDLGGTFASFVINPLDLCIETNTLAVGTDTACIVACDNLGYCDTTLISLTVVEPNTNVGDTTLVAVNDTLFTPPSTELVYQVLDNDKFPSGNELSVRMLDRSMYGPFHGIARMNEDGTVSYLPSVGFCATDSFRYELCVGSLCDTATVFVTVDCSEPEPEPEDLVIHNGFSPNGDGVNDFFVIQGIENFPDAELVIYNRWGNQIHQAIGYMNDWSGAWEGKIIPSGTYFYYLKLTDNRVFYGPLQINR